MKAHCTLEPPRGHTPKAAEMAGEPTDRLRHRWG